MRFFLKITLIYILIIFQIVFFPVLGICAEGIDLFISKSNLSPQILLQQNLLQAAFAPETDIAQLNNPARQYNELLVPKQDSGWIDIEQVNFPIEVIISSSQQPLITFERVEERSFWNKGVDVKIFARNHFYDYERSEIFGGAIFNTGHRFIKSTIEEDEFATIAIQMKSHYLKIKNSGSMDLNIMFESKTNAPAKLTVLSLGQIEHVFFLLNQKYPLNPLQKNIIKNYLLGKSTLEATAYRLTISQKKNNIENLNWSRLLSALPLTAKHKISIELAENIIEQIWHIYKQFGIYKADDYIDDVLELVLVGEIAPERFWAVYKAYEDKADRMTDILKMAGVYCAGEKVEKSDVPEWIIFDFLNNEKILGIKLNFMQVQMLMDFLNGKKTLAELKKDPLNGGILGQIDKLAYPNTDISPWKRSVLDYHKQQAEDIEILAKISFIMFQAERNGLKVRPFVVETIAMYLESIAKSSEALYPMSLAALDKARKDTYTEIDQAYPVYYSNLKSIIDDAKVLANYQPPKIEIPVANKQLKKIKIDQNNTTIIRQSI